MLGEHIFLHGALLTVRMLRRPPYSCSPFVYSQPRPAHDAEGPLGIGNKLVPTTEIPHIYDNVVYRKTSRPPAAYSPNVRVVVEGCRADGGEEQAIALLPKIFSGGVTEDALTRKMTKEEAREHHHGEARSNTSSRHRRAVVQVYRALLRSDAAGRSHCRLCTVDANQNGWKNAKDVLRHLKRDHFGLVNVCPRWLVPDPHISSC